MAETASQHTLDEVFAEVTQLRDLFARRLMDDKTKNAALEKLAQSNTLLIRSAEDERILAFVKELILLCDRIYNRTQSDAFTDSVLEELLEILARRGIEQIEQLEQFDPRIHSCLSVVPASEAHPANTITQVIRQGYRRGDKVIRPAEVVVAR